jgi:hypothetical protein
MRDREQQERIDAYFLALDVSPTHLLSSVIQEAP